MTPTSDDATELRPGRQRVSLGLAFMLTFPGIVMRLASIHAGNGVDALAFGMAIVGSAFLLSWAAEVAQLDISAGLAIAVLAFIAVLPEYAVSAVFSLKGGHAVARYGPACRAAGVHAASPCSLTLANMTGSNRLLIGVGWSMVVGIAYWKKRKGAQKPGPDHDPKPRRPADDGVTLARPHSVELSYLAVAAGYSLLLPLKRTITIVDAAILIVIFGAYTYRVSRSPGEEPDLVGPARYIGTLTPGRRRAVVGALFVFAAVVILLCAERFAEALVGWGSDLGISEFFLVQWLAPLASEAPELLVAGLYAWRLNSNAGLGTLVSAKVNQWTLLVGSLPVVFAVASGSRHGLPIDTMQRQELFLTAAQSVFGFAVLSNLVISNGEAVMLFSLFWAQFIVGAVIPASARGIQLIVVGVIYLVLAAWVLVRNHRGVGRLLVDGFRTPHDTLHEDSGPAPPGAEPASTAS